MSGDSTARSRSTHTHIAALGPSDLIERLRSLGPLISDGQLAWHDIDCSDDLIRLDPPPSVILVDDQVNDALGQLAEPGLHAKADQVVVLLERTDPARAQALLDHGVRGVLDRQKPAQTLARLLGLVLDGTLSVRASLTLLTSLAGGYDARVRDLSLATSEPPPPWLDDLNSAAGFRARFDQVSGQFCIVEIGRGIQAMTGLTPQSVMADPAHLLRRVPAGDRRQLFAAFRYAYGHMGPLSQTLQVKHADGTRRWLNLRTTTALDPEGGRTLEGIIVDVTAQKQAESRAEADARAWQTLADKVPSVICRQLLEGDKPPSWQFISSYAEQLFGIGAVDLTAEPERLFQRVHQADRGRVRKFAKRPAGANGDVSIEFRLQFDDGTTRFVQWIARDDPCPDGVVERYSVFFDLTEQARITKALAERNRDLITRVRLRDLAMAAAERADVLDSMLSEICAGSDLACALLLCTDETSEDYGTIVARAPTGLAPSPSLCAAICAEDAGGAQPVRPSAYLFNRIVAALEVSAAAAGLLVPIDADSAPRCLLLVITDRVSDTENEAFERTETWIDALRHARDLRASASSEHMEVSGPPSPEPALVEIDLDAAELTARQREVLEHIARGLSNRAIADHMGLSEATVKIHVRGVLRALGVKNRTQAANIANQRVRS